VGDDGQRVRRRKPDRALTLAAPEAARSISQAADSFTPPSACGQRGSVGRRAPGPRGGVGRHDRVREERAA